MSRPLREMRERDRENATARETKEETRRRERDRESESNTSQTTSVPNARICGVCNECARSSAEWINSESRE
jgi:hypothetical protein